MNLLPPTTFTFLFITAELTSIVNAFTTSFSLHSSTGTTGTHTARTPSIILLKALSSPPTNDENQTRRTFINQSILSSLLLSSSFTTSSRPAFADNVENSNSGEQDLTSQMFNEDGSLKAGSSTADIEAKSTTVSVLFPVSKSGNVNDSAIVSVDGNKDIISSSNSSENNNESKIKISYEVPDKWTAAPDYLDTLLSIREKACDHITVYQVPGIFKDNSVLEKATTIGVGKALNFSSIGQSGVFPKSLLSADVISGRKVNKVISSKPDDSGEKKQKYYEFDLAVAPDTCGQSAENLGLGFCPYDTIVLISATIVDEKMMVCGVSCTKDEWKRANADLKRVRGSFFVESV